MAPSLVRSDKLSSPPVLGISVGHLVGFPHAQALATQMMGTHRGCFHDLVEIGYPSVIGTSTAAIKHGPFHVRTRSNPMVVTGLELGQFELFVPLIDRLDGKSLKLFWANFLVVLMSGLCHAQCSKRIFTSQS